MSAKIVLTTNTMEEARNYVPLAEKEAWVAENAPKCFDKLEITADNEPMPPMYMVNTGLKSRYLMAALVKLYFGVTDVKCEPNDEWLMTHEAYDEWAGGHIFNQLERYKRDTDLKFKAYDLLYDYKDLEKRFSAQISSLLAVQNDTVIRQSQQMANSVRELPEILEQLKAMQGENSNGE
jgi:hypothetical protein